MLKWLRKYNNIILVIGGILLMIAFLLPQTITELGKYPLGSAPMRVNGRKVSYEAYERASREYAVVNELLFRTLPRIGGGESPEHYLMLAREAEEGGFVGGPEDGSEFITTAMRAALFSDPSAMFMQPDQIEAQANQMAEQIRTERVAEMAANARLSEQDVLKALAKVQGIFRMRTLFMSAPRFSDRRVVAALKESDDAAVVDYLFIPPDREAAGIPDPDAAALAAHFDKYKSVKPGEGEFGIGYLLPARVKLAWLYLDRDAVQNAISADPLEVRKRFLKAHPTGQLPAGQSEEAVMAGFETNVKAEQTERVMKAADVVIKGEIERATRKLESEGSYKRVPADWVRPDFEKIRDLIVQRVKEATGSTIPAPGVNIQAAAWLTDAEVRALPGIGSATLRTGNNAQSLGDLVFQVREIAGPNPLGLQVGIPFIEPLTTGTGGRYYFMVLDARKESAPDSLEEIRAKAISDYKNLLAFERLKEKQTGLRDAAISQGLDVAGKSGAPDGAGDIVPKLGVRVTGSGVGFGDHPSVDTEEFRKAVLKAAAKLDPLGDISKVDAAERTVVVAIPKSQGIAVAKINTVSPVTIERIRQRQNRVAFDLSRSTVKTPADDPYSLMNMEKRLGVEYLDGRLKEGKTESTEAEASESKS